MCLKHNLGDIREVSKANHQLLMVKGGGEPTNILNVCFHVNKYLVFVIVTAVVVVKVVPIKYINIDLRMIIKRQDTDKLQLIKNDHLQARKGQFN